MSAAPFPPPAPTPIWHMYRALVGVGLVCGLLIVSAYELTKPIIRRNRVEARQRAVFEVLEGAETSTAFRLGDDGAFTPVAPDSQGNDLVFAGFDAVGDLVGVAIEAEGQGYADVVTVLYGYSLVSKTVIGLKVLESRETPGLGDRTENDPDYLENFDSLDVSLTDDGKALRHPIEFVKHGLKEHPWQIDGITGATITSRAIAEMVASSAAYWIPRVEAQCSDFRRED